MYSVDAALPFFLGITSTSVQDVKSFYDSNATLELSVVSRKLRQENIQIKMDNKAYYNQNKGRPPPVYSFQNGAHGKNNPLTL